MKKRLLHLGLILSSFIGYLEWGEDQSSFLIQSEWDVIRQIFSNPEGTLHPLIWLPLFGQVVLLVAAFKKGRTPLLTWLGVAGLGILLYFMFLIGFLGGGWLTSLSTVPFIVLSIWTLRDMKRSKP